MPWHNPVLVAEQAATLDLLTGGRFDFGVGKGYRKGEFEGFCIPIEEASERFDEAMEIIRKAWTTEGRFTHHGKRWHYDNILVEPEPLTRPHPPFWMAAGSDESIKRAAREGYCLLLDQLASVQQAIDRANLFREECERIGRAYNPLMVGLARALQMFHTEEDRAAAIATRKRVVGVIGDLAKGERPKSIEEDDAPLLGLPQRGDRAPEEARGRRRRVRTARRSGSHAELAARLRPARHAGLRHPSRAGGRMSRLPGALRAETPGRSRQGGLGPHRLRRPRRRRRPLPGAAGQPGALRPGRAGRRLHPLRVQRADAPARVGHPLRRTALEGGL